MTRTMFMHTIDGKPGTFCEIEGGGQICFAAQGRWHRRGLVLCDSLAQIKREQAITRRWRQTKGYAVRDKTEYSYARVEVPNVR